MLENYNLKNILFLDIETVPQFSKHEELPEAIRDLWKKKSETFRKGEDEQDWPQSQYRRAGIYAEFGKIICISCGYFTPEKTFRIKSFSGHDEKEILIAFCRRIEFLERSDFRDDGSIKSMCGT